MFLTQAKSSCTQFTSQRFTAFCFIACKPTSISSEYSEQHSQWIQCFWTIVIMLKWGDTSPCHFCATINCPFTPPDPALPTDISLALGWRTNWDKQCCPLTLSTHIIFAHIKYFSEKRKGTQGKGRSVKSQVLGYICCAASCQRAGWISRWFVYL